MATVDDGTPAPYQAQPITQPPRQPKSKIWLFLGLGCLIPLLLCGGCLGLGYFGLRSALQGSEPYTQSLAAAQANEAVRTALGQPIEGGMPMGNISVNNDDGEADLNYTISGPEGEGTVHVVATKTDGLWVYHTMTATVNGQRIDLQEPAATEQPELEQPEDVEQPEEVEQPDELE